MADVFISYARSTERQAKAAAAALRKVGLKVWLDEDLPAHRTYTHVIEEELLAAKAVLVIWSAEAVRSEWVLSEANRAREERKLVQVTTDKMRLPMPFDQIQCADLAGWSGEGDTAGWRKVVESVAALIGAPESLPPQDPLLALPHKPSIAVLPFANLSNDPEQEHFADGMVEEIVATLSRYRTIFVIGSGSSLSLKGKGLSPQEAAGALGVRYLLEGSVRKSGDRVRVAVKLTDASDGAQIWNERFDDVLEDVFALQDRVALSVAGIIQPAIETAEIERAARRPTGSMGAYDLYLRALPLFRLFTKTEMFRAIDLLDQAIELDPDFAIAMALAATCHSQIVLNGWTDDVAPHEHRIRELTARALAGSRDDAVVFAQVASAYMSGLDDHFSQAVALIDRAIGLNPGSSFVWMISGFLKVRSGAPDVALEHLETAMRLDPVSVFGMIARRARAFALFEQGRFAEAAEVIAQTTESWRGGQSAIVAAVYGHLGITDEARAALSEYRAYSSRPAQDWGMNWFRRPDDQKLFLDGIALAEGGAPTDNIAAD